MNAFPLSPDPELVKLAQSPPEDKSPMDDDLAAAFKRLEPENLLSTPQQEEGESPDALDAFRHALEKDNIL